MKKRNPSYFGHILQKEEPAEKEIIQGTTSGQREAGRPRTRWEDNITKWTSLKEGVLL